MRQEQRFPDGLAAMPPGPELAAVLAGLDLDPALVGDAVELLRASARQLAHDQARFFAAMVQVGRAVADEAKRDRPPTGRALMAEEWAGAEIGAALTWTTTKADREHYVAEVLVCRLPLVFAELQAGRIDQGRAWTFVDVLGCAELTEEQIERICAALVPVAPGLTSGQIRARLLRLLIGVDPGYAARRYRRAVRERGVHGYLGKDGTATITATGLSTDEAVAACERIEHLADAVKTAGHPATLTQIQADLFTRLLDGRLDGMGRDEMVAAMLADAVADAEADAETDADVAVARAAADAQSDAAADVPAAAVPAAADVPVVDVPVADVPAAVSAAADVPAADVSAPEESAAARPAADSSAPATGSAPSADPERVADPGSAEAPAAVEDPESADVPAAADTSSSDEAAIAQGAAESGVRPSQPCRGGEVRVGLATLMHRDERPGEVPGWGPVLAGVARAMAGRQHRSEWRFAVTDADGYLVLAGVTRRRPRGRGGQARECLGGVVEIHVPAALLVELSTASESCGEWAAVVADIAGQYARRHRLQRVLDARPDDRFACAVLRRHIQVRDRTCVAPGCRRPARRCDQDHTLDHELGGLTVAANTGPLCRRHHRMKHEGGWVLEQPRPGHFCWTSPLGRVYRTRGEPIDPPQIDPEPRGPEDSGDLDEATSRFEYEGPILQRPPPAPPAPPPPPSPPQRSEDDVPPF